MCDWKGIFHSQNTAHKLYGRNRGSVQLNAHPEDKWTKIRLGWLIERDFPPDYVFTRP